MKLNVNKKREENRQIQRVKRVLFSASGYIGLSKLIEPVPVNMIHDSGTVFISLNHFMNNFIYYFE
ncbi:MAG: hypothetical protein CVV44_21540 [Spirochaetae bacterium HGW-Spirochaetae-1]|nr:MAG: hypothetical protein CVV44_21540 [Spirochaetae bacterium HGW-Spirochaetae-1]